MRALKLAVLGVIVGLCSHYVFYNFDIRLSIKPKTTVQPAPEEDELVPLVPERRLPPMPVLPKLANSLPKKKISTKVAVTEPTYEQLQEIGLINKEAQ